MSFDFCGKIVATVDTSAMFQSNTSKDQFYLTLIHRFYFESSTVSHHSLTSRVLPVASQVGSLKGALLNNDVQ
jgi:hypothetical protein